MKESLDEQSRQSLIGYRLDRAYETMKEANLLAKEGFYNAAVNRLYYACFYASIALLVANGLATNTFRRKDKAWTSFYFQGLT